MKLLAIDPGYGRIGFAVLIKNPNTKKESLTFSECFETGGAEEFDDRVLLVGKRMEDIIKKYTPECVVIEQLFFSKNKKTALLIAEIRGMCIYIAKRAGLEVVGYTPNQIKSAVTGNGNANKKDIARMIPLLIDIEMKKDGRYDDEYDAIATGITHFAACRNTHQNKMV